MQKQEKLKKREVALQKRNDAIMDKALEKYASSAMETDRAYIDSALADNPGWVRPLAQLIRHGALKGLLRNKAGGLEDEEDQGKEKWRGKCKKLVDLPETVKVAMLQASGVDVPEPLTGAALDAAFALQFWIASSVAIPNHSRVRWVETLKEFARARYRDLPFNFLIQDRLGKIAKSAGEDATMECLRLWKVDTSEEKVTLSCLMVDTEPLTCDLPKLPADDEWELDDPWAPDAKVFAQSNPDGPFRFTCRVFFTDLDGADPSRKWNADYVPEPVAASAASVSEPAPSVTSS